MKPESRSDARIGAYTRWIIRHRWWVLAAAMAVAVVAGVGARNLGLSTDYRTFFSEDNPDLLAYERVEDVYTKNDNVLFGHANPKWRAGPPVPCIDASFTAHHDPWLNITYFGVQNVSFLTVQSLLSNRIGGVTYDGHFRLNKRHRAIQLPLFLQSLE